MEQLGESEMQLQNLHYFRLKVYEGVCTRLTDDIYKVMKWVTLKRDDIVNGVKKHPPTQNYKELRSENRRESL